MGDDSHKRNRDDDFLAFDDGEEEEAPEPKSTRMEGDDDRHDAREREGARCILAQLAPGLFFVAGRGAAAWNAEPYGKGELHAAARRRPQTPRAPQ